MLRTGRVGTAGVVLFAALLALSEPAAAQQSALSLAEAIELAHRNNPDYLAQRNDADLAEWNVRAAWGALLPGASASTSFNYQAAGEQRFGLISGSDLGIGTSTDYFASSYSLGLQYRLDGSTLFAPARERAGQRATLASIEAARYDLDAAVTRQYLAVRLAEDGVVLARQELARAEENVRLAEARVTVGAAIRLEAQQAEVERGRAQVELLRAENLVRTERLRLGQVMGTALDDGIALSTTFAVTAVPWERAALVERAMAANPVIVAARENERAAGAGVRMARSAYFPSLSASAGWSGFARQAGNESFLIEQARQNMASQAQQCQLLNDISAGLSDPLPNTPADCSGFVLTPEQERRIRADNSVFPFGYTSEPFSAQLMISLPIFQGFDRERQLELARVQRSDAVQRVRAEELRVRTEVETALLNLETARRAVELQTRNRSIADEQLELERERYRVGLASFVELQEAETLKARADREFLTAVYTFHENLAALETAVGSSLRVTQEER